MPAPMTARRIAALTRLASLLAALAVLTSAAARPAFAQGASAPAAAASAMARPEQARSPGRTIRVVGRGEVQESPDLAFLSLAIETQAASAEECAGANAAMAQKVVKALREKLGAKGKVWTGNYRLYPRYSQGAQGQPPAIASYVAENSVELETGAMELLGSLIDSAVSAGANRVNYLRFGLRDDSQARSAAIARAAQNAQRQAAALATALDLKLGPVLSASTVAPAARPYAYAPARAQALAAAATPVATNTVDVSAEVDVVYAVQ